MRFMTRVSPVYYVCYNGDEKLQGWKHARKNKEIEGEAT
jgi:hypothetical protein